MNTHKHTHIKINFEISTPYVVIKDRSRIFEKESEGLQALNIPEIVSKIDCSLSAANLICSMQAIENAFEITPSKQTILIREIILMAETIHSHLNHLYKKIIPHLHGVTSYFEFIKKYEKEYQKNNECLLKSEKVLLILGKRHTHPINSVIGGHLILIDEDEKKEIILLLKELISHIIKTSEFLGKHQKYSFDIIDKYSSLWDLDTTPLLSGKIKLNDEEPKLPREYYGVFDAANSSFVGPISRINNNKKLLSSQSEKLIKKNNLKFPISNPYQSPIALAIETTHLLEQVIEILQNTHFEHETRPIFNIKEGKGFSCVESAKGTISHYYEIDNKGKIIKARIISPIEQNERFLQKAVKNLPFDPDKKTRKQLLDEIDLLIDLFYV